MMLLGQVSDLDLRFYGGRINGDNDYDDDDYDKDDGNHDDNDDDDVGDDDDDDEENYADNDGVGDADLPCADLEGVAGEEGVEKKLRTAHVPSRHLLGVV